MEPGDPPRRLHEDHHCTCDTAGPRAIVTTHRDLDSWWLATPAERDSLLHALGIARSHLANAFPRATLHIAWQERPPDSAPGPLRIEVSAQTPSSGPHDRGLIRGDDDPLLDHLADCFPRAVRVDIAVAFVLDRGVTRVRPYLEDLLAREHQLRLITGDYFGATEPDGLQILLDLNGSRELRAFECKDRSFHPKAYLFHFANGDGVAFVGSSNLSHVALGNGIEWNYRIVRARDGDGFASVCEGFERLFRHPSTVPLTHEWISAYRSRRQPDAPRRVGLEPEVLPAPDPHEIQAAALQALDDTRQKGNAAGLVVLATGLGKTWLSAFDSRRFRRVLFVAHRDEILDQARQTYRRIRPGALLGRYTGTEKNPAADVLFASVQTLGKARHLREFAPDHFDYIVVDEFHHAAAQTYRKVLAHFTPTFLLGLTATPERSDGADLLTLCGNNLVYRCDLAAGVRSGLLCPFEYHGVPDDVDYAQIPWRSARFDEEELTRALATQQRAQNAFEQHQRLGGRRTLAFCVSQKHADFMRSYFLERGKRAASVHAGDSSDPRANSLEGLRRGDLDIVFSVDMFNEGVDVPDIDTVMMLRPTGSRVLWLQQLGRGLRRAEGKQHLRVIDYIGNHRTFLDKPRALLGTLLGLGEDHAALRMALQQLRDGTLELPPGCSVTYQLEVIAILEQLLRPRPNEDVLKTAYDEFKERHARRPTAAELHGGGALQRNSLRGSGSSWFTFVDQQGDLDNQGKRLLTAHGEFFRELEQSRMERSYKMLALLALLELEQMPGSCSVRELAERLERIAQRSPLLREELAQTLSGGQDLTTMVRQNPLRSWAGTRHGRGSQFFSLDGDSFATTFTVDEQDHDTFTQLVRELVDWRLALYLEDATGTAFECKVTHNDRAPILMLPDRSRHPGLPDGDVQIQADGELWEARFVKIAVNVVRRKNDEAARNALPELLQSWFGPNAGQSGTHDRVRFVATPDGYAMAPVVARSPQAAVRGLDDAMLDAHFVVETAGQRASVVYRSRGGTKGTNTARNVDYTSGLDALLERARRDGLVLADALLDSESVQSQPVAERRLRLEGAEFPVDLGTVADAASVRRWLAKAQREHGGNETRQLRLVFENGAGRSAVQLARQLAGENTTK